MLSSQGHALATDSPLPEHPAATNDLLICLPFAPHLPCHHAPAAAAAAAALFHSLLPNRLATMVSCTLNQKSSLILVHPHTHVPLRRPSVRATPQARVARLASELQSTSVRAELLSAKGTMYDKLNAQAEQLRQENQRLQVCGVEGGGGRGCRCFVMSS